MSRAPRRSGPARLRLAARVFVLLAFLAAGAFAAKGLWSELVEPAARPVVRDYLAFRRAERFRDELLAAARESGVDPNLLAAIMVVESGGRVDARSTKDALGLFQVTLDTALWRAEILGLERPTEAQLLSDAALNARLGADTFAWLLETFDGDVERALIAYNVGSRRLATLVREAGSWEAWRAERARDGDSELLQYAARVLDYRGRFVERGLFPPESGPGAGG